MNINDIETHIEALEDCIEEFEGDDETLEKYQSELEIHIKNWEALTGFIYGRGYETS